MKAVFDNSFFDAEERDGFWVQSLMKKNWAVQIDIVCEIDEICRRHGLTYWFDYGSLLGAVRHKGFIPWDDDIDISMKRIDYEKFLGYAYKELPSYYRIAYLQGHAGDPLKILCRSNITIDEITYSKLHGFPYISGVDIFPYDNIPDGEAALELKDLVKSILGVSQFWENEDTTCFSYEEKMESIDIIEQVTGTKIDLEDDVVKQLHYLCDRVSSMYYDEPSQEMARVLSYTLHNGSVYPREWLNDFEIVPFENIFVPIPCMSEEILGKLYRDWRRPVRFAATHNYPFFKSQVDELVDYASKNNYPLSEEFIWKNIE